MYHTIERGGWVNSGVFYYNYIILEKNTFLLSVPLHYVKERGCFTFSIVRLGSRIFESLFSQVY